MYISESIPDLKYQLKPIRNYICKIVDAHTGSNQGSI